MKITKLFTAIVFGLGIKTMAFTQCEITASANPAQIYCGQSSTLTAFGIGAGTVVLSENFNSGFGPGWSGTPGATSFSNPCSPGGVDGTPHAWMDNNTSVPRTLTSASFDISGATAGVTICFDLLFATQGQAAPCEGPDEPDEGVYFQYSTDGGATWHTIHYFNPNGGYDNQLTNWNNWCFQIPPGAITAGTMFRWHQTADSGAGYDHWGIDNVQIVQNDINAEIVWGTSGDDYYHSYGVGSSGGTNPNQVSPTTTTTYDVVITTGTGQQCSTSVTVVVLDPVYDIDINVSPSTICAGDCASITGSGQIILDPGGIETYENAEIDLITGTPAIPFISPGFIEADMNINVVGINPPTVSSGLITSVCINSFSIIPFGPGSVSLANVSIVLTCPSGTSITLANVGDLSGTTITNMCFENGAAPLSGGSAPYTGTFNPAQSLDLLNGCSSEGVWNLTISGSFTDFSLPFGSISGWNITFDDPPVYAPVDYSWSPTTGLSNPNDINTQACPTSSTNYVLTVSNGVPECAVHTENVAITVDPCNGCITPMVFVDALTVCAPNTVDLEDAINPSSEPATLSFHTSQADAQNDVNPMSNTTVSSSGSYWVRAENPSADTCFAVHEIIVTIAPQDDATFAFDDFCDGTANGPSSIATAGGSFAFNPVPSDGATINASTGVISNAVAGTTYSVEYTTNGTCPNSHVETVTVNANPTPIISGNFTYCPGGSAQLDAGGGYTNYLWSPSNETTQNISTTTSNPITVTVTDANGCIGTSNPVNVNESNVSEYHSSITICSGESIVVHGNAVSAPGVYIDTFAVSGGCDSVSIVTVNENVISIPVIVGNLWYCAGQTVTLSTNPANYASYSWSTGSTQPTINTTTNQPITVTVTDANGCTATSAPVSLIHPPQAVLNANPSTGTAPLIVDLTNNSTGANSYDWFVFSVDTFSTTTMAGYTHTYDSLGTYTVMLVAHSDHCSDTAFATIYVVEPVAPLDLIVPNVFTPNGDGVNDFFVFDAKNIAQLELIIVNRWGNLVYETNDVNFMWDGKDTSGNPVTEGVYFYDYKVVGVMGDELSGHGFVTVER